MKIIPMTAEHLHEVFQIEESSFSTPWSFEALSKELTDNKNAHYFVAVNSAGALLGYAGLWHVVNEGHITNIAVAAEHRKKGVGSALVRQLIAFAREKQMTALTLEVRYNNAAAQKLYLSHGFTIEGRRKQYYSDTKEDALIMWLVIPNTYDL